MRTRKGTMKHHMGKTIEVLIPYSTSTSLARSRPGCCLSLKNVRMLHRQPIRLHRTRLLELSSLAPLQGPRKAILASHRKTRIENPAQACDCAIY